MLGIMFINVITCMISFLSHYSSQLLCYTNCMTIIIGWEYFLGIFVSLVGIAWYSSARFTKLETSMKWVEGILKEIKVSSDNASTPAFASTSPINLTATGEKWLVESGLKQYIDTNKEMLIKFCMEKQESNPYEVQKHIFKLWDDMDFDKGFEDNLKQFAFSKGTTMLVVRRVGAIYHRNLCLERFGMSREDIEVHQPK